MVRFAVFCLLMFSSPSFAIALLPMKDPADALTCAEWLTKGVGLIEGRTAIAKATVVEADDTYILSDTGYAIIMGEAMSPSGTGAHFIFYLPVSLEEMKSVGTKTVLVRNEDIQRTTLPGRIYGGFRAGLLSQFLKGEVDMYVDVTNKGGMDQFSFSYSGVKLF